MDAAATASSQPEPLFAALFEHALDAMLIANDDRLYVDANPAACLLIGLQREQIVGHPIEAFFEMDEEQVPHAWELFQKDAVQSGICLVRRADGTVRYAGYRAKLNFVPGLHLSILRDVTDQREALLQLEAEKRKVQVVVNELAESNAALQQFAYVTCHDLSEPLRSMRTYAEFLRRRYTGKFDAEADEFLSFIVSGASRMNELLTDLLSYSRASGCEATDPELVDLNKVLAWAGKNLQMLVKETGADIQSSDLPPVIGDELQLVQVFQNLLSNAIKFRRPEEALRIQVSAESKDGEVVVTVRDNGIGIRKADQSKIFVIFGRLHGREIPGTGIGLTICQKIVQNHGGRIWVESEPGEGAAFVFTLPASPA